MYITRTTILLQKKSLGGRRRRGRRPSQFFHVLRRLLKRLRDVVALGELGGRYSSLVGSVGGGPCLQQEAHYILKGVG